MSVRSIGLLCAGAALWLLLGASACGGDDEPGAPSGGSGGASGIGGGPTGGTGGGPTGGSGGSDSGVSWLRGGAGETATHQLKAEKKRNRFVP